MVLFEVILGGEDILNFIVSMLTGFLCTRFVLFGEAARVRSEDDSSGLVDAFVSSFSGCCCCLYSVHSCC